MGLRVFPRRRRTRAESPIGQLTVATADTGRLTKTAMFGLDCIWRDGFLNRRAGVIFPVLTKAGAVQGSLFLHPDDPRSKSLECWLPVVWLQLRIRDLAGAAERDGVPLPPLCRHYAAWWFALGWPAFAGVTGIFYSCF